MIVLRIMWRGAVVAGGEAQSICPVPDRRKSFVVNRLKIVEVVGIFPASLVLLAAGFR